MSSYVRKSLERFNPNAFNQFLRQMGLPDSFEEKNKNSVISEPLWQKILDVQKKGGSQSLFHNLNLVKKSNEDLTSKTLKFEAMIKVIIN